MAPDRSPSTACFRKTTFRHLLASHRPFSNFMSTIRDTKQRFRIDDGRHAFRVRRQRTKQGGNMTSRYLRHLLLGTALTVAFVAVADARSFNMPGGSLESALDAYAAQTGMPLIVSSDAIRGARTNGVKGDLSPHDA